MEGNSFQELEVKNRYHDLFSKRKNQDVVCYTDGPCIDNPGRAGFGAYISSPSNITTLLHYHRIASILTAELCAICKALQCLCLSVSVVLFTKVIHGCVDNVAARGLSQGDMGTIKQLWDCLRYPPSRTNFVCKRAHNILALDPVTRTYVSLAMNKRTILPNLQWSTLAIQHHPKRPSNSPSFLYLYPSPRPNALWRMWDNIGLENVGQYWWLNVLLQHMDVEHFSRIRTSSKANKMFSLVIE